MKCERCAGSGMVEAFPDMDPKMCPQCHGSGVVEPLTPFGEAVMAAIVAGCSSTPTGNGGVPCGFPACDCKQFPREVQAACVAFSEKTSARNWNEAVEACARVVRTHEWPADQDVVDEAVCELLRPE